MRNPKPWKACIGNHDWKPIEKWPGRYSCENCGTAGYHQLASGRAEHFVQLRGSHDAQIVPYLCPKCHGPTTKAKSPCLVCLKPAPAKKACWKALRLYGPDGRLKARVERVPCGWPVQYCIWMDGKKLEDQYPGVQAAKRAAALFVFGKTLQEMNKEDRDGQPGLGRA